MWGSWDSWKDEKEKIRIQSLKRLVEIIEFCREDLNKFRKKDLDVKEILDEFNWYYYPVSAEDVAEHFGISRRTAQDYLLTIKAIAGLLLESEKEDKEE